MTPEEIALSAGLTPAQSAAFLAYCDGEPIEAIAARLGVTVNAVRVRLSKAGARIREERARQAVLAEVDDLIERLESVVGSARY